MEHTNISTVKLEFHNLPKVSLNTWYAGTDWRNRKRQKDAYSLILSKSRNRFKKNCKYNVYYNFTFKTRPLDATNTIAMVKMIEDVLFEDDSYKIVLNVSISSRKGDSDKVTVNVSEL